MKCFPRSTRLSASCSVVLLLTAMTEAAGAPNDRAIADAIERAVQARIGSTATVVVSSLDGVRITGDVEMLIAAPEPGARVGGPMRFLLSSARSGRPVVRVGEAVALVEIAVPAVKSTRTLVRGERLTGADVTAAIVKLEAGLLRPLLSLEEAIGARAARDISAHTLLTRADLAVEPLVRAGDVVRAHARIGDADVVGDMVAVESGNRDDVIRVVNQETRRAAHARIAARGEVEVVNVH